MRRAASRPAEPRGPREAGRAQLRPPVERVQDRAGEVALVGEDRGVARHLDERRVGRGDDGRPARHRLEHRQPEALVPGRDDERGRLAVEARELLVIHVPAHVGAEPAQLGRERRFTLRAYDDDRHAELVARVHGCAWILAALHRADHEQVARVPRRLVRREDRVDPVRNHLHRRGRDPVELFEVFARPFGDGDHTVGAPRRARDDRAEDEPVLPRHQIRLALEGQVVNGQDRAAAGAERERVLVVRDPGPEPTDEAREAPRHAPLLRAGGELDRLDPVGNELRLAGDGGEVEVRSGAWERAQQVPDVGLVARALAAEDVGIEEDVDHAAASR